MSGTASTSNTPLIIDSQEAGETFVRTLRDHSGFCYWCLAPLRVSPVVQFTDEGPEEALRTARTFDEYSTPLEDVPPDRIDHQGQVVEYVRDKRTICGRCGEIDPAPQDSRTKETTQQALIHVLSILEENAVGGDRETAQGIVADAFEKGHTGQFSKVVGSALFQATSVP
ncbi:hypothetical protein NP511_22615 (plasmid) [Natrinema thermotolerans]|uniref:Uncharacterized protein n=1 Tax=Natrinema thermotolerans TaxID=121872 RepID=A0AAF0PGQ4_9EURY|nr:hypothetical protein [Natrinema thermotolerans]WMT10361.1 hypothetical protein NP511_22615 [Natrinema thermotolerans]